MTIFQSFRDYLSRNHPDINIQIEPESSISFSFNNLNYRFVYYVGEPTYFRLMLPRVAAREGVSIESLSRIACEVSAGYKVGKMELISDEFWVCYEQLIDPNANNDSVYSFSIRVLDSMIASFRERMSSLQVGQQS